MINTIIGKYKLLRLIGEGGMASVYEAEHEILATRVAIKVLNPILSANSQIRERFTNEAKMMASLNHPNIIKVIDFDEQPHQLSIVLELLEGEDLDVKIKKNVPLSDNEISNIFSQTLSAFEYAHSKGIVHRDIKPGNIYILPNGTVKILDFGIAKLFGQGNEMTQTGTQMGTPIYMSPEQIRGEKSIDHRSDIYSLGVTLFVAVCGKTPYDSKTESQFDVFNKIVHEPLPEISGNGKFNALINKACNKDREQRFQSCGEWLEEMNVKNSSVSQSKHIDEAKFEKSVETEVEIETKDVLENIPTRFFNLNRLLIGLILGSLVGEFVFLVGFQELEDYKSLLLLCIISSSILFFKPSKIILRITITVFALLCLGLLNNYIFLLEIFLPMVLIIFIALFCSFMSFNKTSFVFYILAFILLIVIDLTSVFFASFNSVTICFILIYLCSIIVFFFYNKYFGKFLIGAICFMNLVILSSPFILERESAHWYYVHLFLLLLLPIIELSSKIQPKVLTR